MSVTLTKAQLNTVVKFLQEIVIPPPVGGAVLLEEDGFLLLETEGKVLLAPTEDD